MSLEEEKKSLVLKQELYKENLENDLALLQGDYKKIGLWALIGAATVLGGYVLIKRFLPERKKNSNAKQNYVYDQQGTELVLQKLPPQESSPLVAKIKEHITLFILGIIKEKLTSLLKDSQAKK